MQRLRCTSYPCTQSYYVPPPPWAPKEKYSAFQAGSRIPSSVLNRLLRQGIDPAKDLRPLSTSAGCSDSCRRRSLTGGLVLRVHPPLKDGPKAGAPENKSSFSAQLASASAPPLALPRPSLPSALRHSHLCRPCQMVQGVLVVQEGLVVLLSERIGGKRERKVYFCIRRNLRAKSESHGQVLQLNPKSALTLHPSGHPPRVGSEELRTDARLFGKCFCPSTSSGLPAGFTGGLCWESKLVTGSKWVWV